MKPLTFIFKFLIFALGVLFAVFLVKSASAVELDRRHAAQGLYQGCPGELAEARGFCDDHPLPDVARSGKLPIKVFLYKNLKPKITPSRTRPSSRTKTTRIRQHRPSADRRLSPFGKDLESARPAFMELLANF